MYSYIDSKSISLNRGARFIIALSISLSEDVKPAAGLVSAIISTSSSANNLCLGANWSLSSACMSSISSLIVAPFERCLGDVNDG